MGQNITSPRLKKFPVTCHTKHVRPGSTFVAIKGDKQDGVTYIPKAIKRGASKIVMQYDAIVPPEIKQVIEQSEIEIELVENTRLALAQLSEKASDYAHKQLKIIGITGTKGKTSTAFILEHLLQSARHKTALISTVHNKIGNKKFKSGLTTDQPDYLHQFFKTCVAHNIEYVVMEVAAQALSLHRVAGIVFDAAVFTNFSQEHGEFYKTLDDYFAAKCTLFDQLKPDAPIFVNADDPWGKKILKQHPTFLSFAVENNNTHLSANIIDSKKALAFKLQTPQTTLSIHCPSLFGTFNTYNVLAALGVAHSIGIPPEQCAQQLQTFKGVPGRLQLHTLKNGARCFIDYAHNPSSYKAVLSTLRNMTDDLIVVFGAGGKRDKEKRPIMGTIASEIADSVILTSDNPRTEDPEQIIQDIVSGVAPNNQHKIKKIVDRKIAIQQACTMAKECSAIALLGKGPDEYQEKKGIKTKFSEKEIVKAYQ